jgi:protein required for attachment to host cells
MATTWIVSANAGRARVFAQAAPVDPLQEINDMVSPTAREPERDIETDRLGQRSASKSRHNVGQATTPSGYQPNQTPRQHEAQLFARDLVHFLQQAKNEGRFAELCLVASPEFLGVLRGELDANLEKAVSVEIDKDFTQLGPQQLLERLRGHGRWH